MANAPRGSRWLFIAALLCFSGLLAPALAPALAQPLAPALAPALAPTQKPLKIAVDIGHTKKKPGATSARGRSEYYFNADLAKALVAALGARAGFDAVLVNPNAAEISLEGRVRAAEAQGCDLFVSIHHDSVQKHYLRPWTHKGKQRFHCDRFAGYSLFVSMRNGAPWKSYMLAYLVGDFLARQRFAPTLHHAEKIKGENRELLNTELGIYRFDDLVVLHKAKIPALLIECGVIVNRQEEETVRSAAFQTAFAAAIAGALADFKALYRPSKQEEFPLYRAQIALRGAVKSHGSGLALCPLAAVCVPLLFQEHPALRNAASEMGRKKLPASFQGYLDYFGASAYAFAPEQQQ